MTYPPSDQPRDQPWDQPGNQPGDQPDEPEGPGQAPYGYGQGPPVPARPPDHPNATTAMVLGIIALAGGVLCVLPVLLAPFAWVMGGRAVREIDTSQGRLGGRGMAQAGYILGIIGTCILALGVLALLAFGLFAVLAGPSIY